MIELIKIRERGPSPRGMRKVWNVSSKTSFLAAADFFDDRLRDRRFTTAHAQAAGYTKRKGEGLQRGTKAYRRSYAGQKESRYKHNRPLEKSGDTRERLRSGGRRTSTRDKARIAYSQARVFNFRHPKSMVRMADEFRRILPEENEQLAEVYDSRLDRELADAAFQPQ